jgi:MarR family transcriptional regulator for hemolysin
MGRRIRYDFENSLGHWVCCAAHAMERAFNEELQPHGITYRQAQVIACLVESPGTTQAAMARRLNVEPPTLAGVLHRMERDGWVRRVPCPEDGRCNRIELLPSVHPVWSKIAACAERVRKRALRGVPVERFEAVRDSLRTVLANLEEDKR